MASGEGKEAAATAPVSVAYTDAPKELLDDVIAAAGRALKAQTKGEIRHPHEVRCLSPHCVQPL